MVEIDIHGLTKQQAKVEIERFIASLPDDVKSIRIIHGYHGGTNLREFVQRPNNIRSKRIKRKKLTMNQGETIYELF